MTATLPIPAQNGTKGPFARVLTWLQSNDGNDIDTSNPLPVIISDKTETADVITNTDDDTNLDETNGLVTASLMYVRGSAGTAKPLRMDLSTHSLQTMSYEHHEVHSGSHYYIEGFTTLGSGDSFYVKLVTPDTDKFAHFVWEIDGSFITETSLTEDATGGMAGGTAVIPFNNNRNSLNTSGMVITSNVTANTGGTVISQTKFGSRSTGGSHSRGDELILKRNTVYCRMFTSSTNSNIISFKASWYEHTDKD